MKHLRGLLLSALALTLAAPASAQSVTAGAGFAALGLQSCETDLRYLNQLSGWQVRWAQEWNELSEAPGGEVRAAIEQWKGAPAALRGDIAALGGGGTGTAPKVIVMRILLQLDDLVQRLEAGPPPLRRDVAPELAAAWRDLFAQEIAPAVRQYRSFLRERYLERARNSAGLAGTPGGADCFRRSVRFYSTLDIAPEQVEAVGWRIVRETEADLMRLHRVPRSKLPALLNRLRAHREDGFTREKLIAVSKAAVARATAAAPRMFLRPAKAPVIISAVPQQMEASFTAAAYQGSGGGDDPARFILNLSRPAERRLMAEVIAFHETIPGHHAVEALGYPYGSPNSGYLEGWGIYAEYLADEMGLYGSDLDRSGMMAKHLWAASRLVMEVGLHVRGWTREQAIAFSRQHTALTEADLEVEVDRSIAGPGQPSSYMLGYDRIVAARRHTEAALGRAFDLREFHEVVLQKGSRPLAELHRDVLDWVEAKKRKSASR